MLGVVGRLILRIIKWIFKKGGGEYVDWINWAQDRDRWQALVNVVVKPSGSIKCREYLD